MGYTDGKTIGGPGEFNSCKMNDKDYCVKD